MPPARRRKPGYRILAAKHPSIHHTDDDAAANMILLLLLLLLLPSASADCFLSSNRSTFPPEPATPFLPSLPSPSLAQDGWRRRRRAHPSIVCIGGLLRGAAAASVWQATPIKCFSSQNRLVAPPPLKRSKEAHSPSLSLSLSLSPFLTLFHVIMYINSFRRRRSHQSAARPQSIQTSDDGAKVPLVVAGSGGEGHAAEGALRRRRISQVTSETVAST